jgi:hypothetical protein
VKKQKLDYISYNVYMGAEYEMVEHEGSMVRYYPGSGALMKEQEDGSMRIVGNRGGNPQMQDPKYAADMALRRAELRNEAIAQGLIEAGIEKGLPGTSQAILTEIVKQRALVATNPNRDGNEAAKFIFSIIRETGEKEKEENVIKFQLTEKQMGDVMGKIFTDDSD